MIVDREKVQEALEGLDGEQALRRLLERELGYDYEGGLIPTDDLPAGVEEEIASDPTLIASTARDGRFAVIYTRLNTSGKLSLTTERKIMERLKKSYPYSLYVFSDAEDKLWHFVNAPLDPEAQAPGHLSGRKQYRRVVVGPGERFRTATERISLLSVEQIAEEAGKEPEDLAPLAVHAAHDEAFDVEAVTKQFFRKYRRVFESVEESIVGLEEDEDRRRYFVQRLFNRLMFVAFIEKKGWMSFRGRTDYLPALWENYDSAGRGEDDFYNGRLKPLFFQGFNSQDDREEEDPVIGVVPYLNGGLFEEDDDDRDESIDVPDGCLDEIINGLFAGFNFTTTESTPLDVEVAVDPEMLGKVFEELVTGRHEVGAYYTPKEIVSFMCREALKGHLEDRIGASDEGDKEAVRAFVEEHDPAGLHDPEAALGALREVRVCDPACGSGAYLLGMMRELLDLRESLFATVNIDPRTTYQRKLEIIQNNLYGVDIDPFAVNIARLRLWLSLVVDYEGDRPPPLPNLDFKIEAGDSLTGPAPTDGLDTPDMVRSGQIGDYFDLKNRYLKAHGSDKTALNERIANLRREITEWAHPEHEIIGFDWQVEFAEIFADSGFDAILANPPYVRADAQFGHLGEDTHARRTAIANWKTYRATLRESDVYQTLYEKWDLYLPFLERAHQLLRGDGQMIFIIPDAYNTSKYAEKSHEFFVRNSKIARLDFCSDISLFNAGVSNTILHFVKSAPTASDAPLRVRHWGDKSEHFNERQEILDTTPQLELGVALFRLNNGLDKLHVPGAVELQQICYVSVGMVINADERKHGGAFNTQELASDVQDATHPKPFVQGKDLFRWCVRQIRYLEWGTERAPSKFRRQTFPELYDVPEKLIAVKVSPEPRIAYDQWQLVHTDGLYSFVPWHYLQGVSNRSISKTSRYKKDTKPNQNPTLGYREDLEQISRRFMARYVLAVMNSTFAMRWLAGRRRNKLQLYPNDWKQLPVAPASDSDQEVIAALVDEIFVLYSEHGYPLPSLGTSLITGIAGGCVTSLAFACRP